MRWAKESTFDLKLLANFRGYIFSGIGWNSLMCLWKSSYDCLACASSVRRAAAWGCSASNASTSFSQPVKSSIRIYKWLSIFFSFFLISSFVFSSVSTYILLSLSCLGLPLPSCLSRWSFNRWWVISICFHLYSFYSIMCINQARQEVVCEKAQVWKSIQVFQISRSNLRVFSDVACVMSPLSTMSDSQTLYLLQKEWFTVIIFPLM